MNELLNILTDIYKQLGVNQVANMGDFWGLVSVLFVFIVSLTKGLSGGTSEKAIEHKPEALIVETPKAETKVVEETTEVQAEITEEQTPEVKEEAPAPVQEKEPEPTPKPAPVPKITWRERLIKGLAQSRSEVWSKVGGFFSGEALSEDDLESIEELLYSADMGPAIVAELIDELREASKGTAFDEESFKQFLFVFLKKKMAPIQEKLSGDLFQFSGEKRDKPLTIMVVGVNGAGKTTTIGKLATKLTGQGAKVVVGACDTFRAAAVDQLQVWCERSGATMVRAADGAAPSGVGYEALQTAISESADYCILDTAGRLHTKTNLMDELSKSKNVLSKLDESAPHQTLLVIDAITGQNALRQAEEFNNALALDGLIFTKCDGSSKAGSAVGIVQKLAVPISYIGVGENVEDLNAFNLDEYLSALLDLKLQ
jgi:fused signal recognition particle receptor